MRVKNLCLVLLLASIALGHEDYYKLLGIDRNANEKVIKKAARKLSLKYHPDRNREDPTAKEMYIKIRKVPYKNLTIL